MTVHIIAGTQVGAGVQVTLGNSDRLFVGEDATLGRTDGTSWSSFTVAGNGSGQIVDIHGTVVGDGLTVNLGENTDIANNTVTIHETGYVRSYRDDAGGVRMLGSELTLDNSGKIVAGGYGVIMDAAQAGKVSSIVNDGTIRSTGDAGIYIYTSAQGIVEVHNTGLIAGVEVSYANASGTPVVDRIYNDGIMKGSVMLGAGDDLYDGRKGTIQGTIDGGIGADTLRGGKGAEVFSGGDGADQLYGGAGRDVFQFYQQSDSMGRTRDLIGDFSRTQKDRIDLAQLDGDVEIKLDFIGDDRFSKSEGEVRFQQVKGATQIQVDLDGDGKADFALDVRGSHDFVASDFLL